MDLPSLHLPVLYRDVSFDKLAFWPMFFLDWGSPKRPKTKNSLPQYFSRWWLRLQIFNIYIYNIYIYIFIPDFYTFFNWGWFNHQPTGSFLVFHPWISRTDVRKSILEAIGVGLRNRMNFGGLVGQLQPLTDQHINFRVIVDAMFGSEGSSNLESVGWWPPGCPRPPAEMSVIWEELTYYALLDSHAWG